jgi:hypothetical protein
MCAVLSRPGIRSLAAGAAVLALAAVAATASADAPDQPQISYKPAACSPINFASHMCLPEPLLGNTALLDEIDTRAG